MENSLVLISSSHKKISSISSHLDDLGYAFDSNHTRGEILGIKLNGNIDDEDKSYNYISELPSVDDGNVMYEATIKAINKRINYD